MDLKLLSRRLKALKSEDIMKSVYTSKIIKDDALLYQKDQLRSGENSEGQVMGYYSQATETMAQNYKQYGITKPITNKVFGANYNFEWSGEFFKSLSIAKSFDSLIIDANRLQLDIYGDDLIGLNQENIKELERLGGSVAEDYVQDKIFKGN